MKKAQVSMIAATLMAGCTLFGHDERLRGANGFIGEVTAVDANGFRLKTKDGVVKVNYSSKTKFEADKKPAERTAIKAGTKVGVAGSKLPSGEVMANDVLIGYVHEEAGGAAKKKAEHKH